MRVGVGEDLGRAKQRSFPTFESVGNDLAVVDEAGEFPRGLDCIDRLDDVEGLAAVATGADDDQFTHRATRAGSRTGRWRRDLRRRRRPVTLGLFRA